MKDHGQTEAERQDYIAGKPQRMKGGQHAQHAVVWAYGEYLGNIAAIGQDIGVAQGHSLGRGFRAGGKQHSRRAGYTRGQGRPLPAQQRQATAQQGREPEPPGNGRSRILQAEPARVGARCRRTVKALSVQTFQQTPGCDNGADLRQTHAMPEIGRAGGPVEHDRRLSRQQHGQPAHGRRA